MRGEIKAEPDYFLKVLAAGLSLGLLLTFSRARIISFGYVPSVPGRAVRLAFAAYYDLLYTAFVTGVFLGLLRMARTGQKARRFLYRAFLGIALFSLSVGLANVRLVPMLGRPLNYQWLYYSDFLRGQDARNAILEQLSGKLLLVLAASLVCLLVVSRILYSVLEILKSKFGRQSLLFTSAAALLLYIPLGAVVIRKSGWKAPLLENPVYSFARSMVIAGRSPRLLTMKTSVGSDDFAPRGPSSPAISDFSGGGARIRNVLFVVLESVPAEYLGIYGAPYPVTPELKKYQGQSAIFTNIYADCPTTSFSLVSLLLSIYPRISYEGLTEERPDVSFPSLSSELKLRGYRTAFFNSADIRHQHCDAFLSHRGFDRIDDYRSMPCNKPVLAASTKNWPFLDGRDDVCSADALIRWIDDAPDRPYFAVLWTMMTHYPYFAAEGQTNFGVAEKFNRYLNALQHDDAMIGRLCRALQERHLDGSTLMVIVGDHGEAFGQHNQWSHARCIYEENVHVPLVLLNPNLFHGERLTVLGGLIDVAPTVLDILGVAPPPSWQGRSLWSEGRSGRVYFFAPWSDHLFGLREGETKVIYDAEDNHFEVYDLDKDPHETTNRAPQRSDAIRVWQQRLAAWAQNQDKMMDRLEAGTPKR